ncbi:restriction endonuclease [Crocosphaera sp. XPORK-15E]|uniref:restriction endonuclease n=1 Tax=Crocosphaera sp. XPORK-15E TaxID=3110247 RepID=UPI002B20980C|nr:restriction endonuclease [Crocosphaera sp. XPORK-15E]MEA5537248.1 restriction endonuclease [Crocosphaera sp. XPORK-15E]
MSSSHQFTQVILDILTQHFGDIAEEIFNKSPLIQYLNIKTKSANRDSKSRPSLGNHYALYVLIEDYINGNFNTNKNYENYEGAKFSDLLRRQRELPFGEKLQNHALNHRLNMEFKKYFPTLGEEPILRDIATSRYWINENLLIVTVSKVQYNIAIAIKDIIDSFVAVRQKSFRDFMRYCDELLVIENKNCDEAIAFIKNLLKPNTDARVFEITSYAILKIFYAQQTIFWGYSLDTLVEDALILYKTGRTNANDGGIDFVMKPLGRFFQVTETVEVDKYFLDIDKIQRYPITFVVKSNETPEQIKAKIKQQAEIKYKIKAIVKRYLNCIEEIINLPSLDDKLTEIVGNNQIQDVIREILIQSKLEFNIDEAD